MQRFENTGSNPKYNAQRNLQGRTHYVDDDTLRFHKSKILSARSIDSGLLFAIVTSDAVDYQNTKRGFRFVVFDMFGTVLQRTSLDAVYRTSAQATKAMWEYVNAIDATAHTREAIARQRSAHHEEMNRLESEVIGLQSKQAA